MPIVRSSLAIATLVASLIACGGSTASTATPGGPASSKDEACSAKADSARQVVDTAIQANQACAKDEDCVIVSLSGACFDACGRVMSASGKAAYDQAGEEAASKYCAAYHADGCPTVMPPPCAPNPPPSCKAGKCG